MAVNDVIKYLQILNHYGITNKDVEDSLTLEIFQLMISESKMFQENDCGMTSELSSADKKPSKNPKMQSLIDVFGGKTLPSLFRVKLLPKALTSGTVSDAFQENILLTPPPGGTIIDESPPRTKGDIIGFNDTEDSESDESIDIYPNVKLLPATVDGSAEYA